MRKHIVDVRENLKIIPGNNLTTKAQTHMSLREKDIAHIDWATQPFSSNGTTDFVVFDTSPSISGVQGCALWAANYVIIPTKPKFMDLQGVAATVKTLVILKKEKGWKGGLLGVLPTFYDPWPTANRAAISDLQARFGGSRKLLLPEIHDATVLSEAAAAGQSIFEWAPRSRAAMEYLKLGEAVLKRSR